MKKLRKLAIPIVVALVLCLPIMTAFAEDTTITGTNTKSVTVPVTGTFTATDISVTHPLNVAYAIDPNQGATDITIPNLQIINNSVVPIQVIVENFASSAGGDIQFIDCPFGGIPDIDTLENSKKFIGLSIMVDIADTTGWDNYLADHPFYSFNTASNDLSTGTLKSNCTGYFAFQAWHGCSFDKVYTAQHSIVFKFKLT
jgi:hypothetical protein